MSYTNRNEIPEKYTWNLGDIFATPDKWEEAFNQLSKEYTALCDFQGKLADRDNLLAFFKLSDKVDLKLEQLYCYAAMAYNEDSQDSVRQARFSKIYGLLNKYDAATSFVSPELSAIPDEQLKAFIADPAFSENAADLAVGNIKRNVLKHRISAKAFFNILNGDHSAQHHHSRPLAFLCGISVRHGVFAEGQRR